jgi:hypothetical protein
MRLQRRLAALALSTFTVCNYGRLSPTSAFRLLTSSIKSRGWKRTKCHSLLLLPTFLGEYHLAVSFAYLPNHPYPQQQSLLASNDGYACPDNDSCRNNLSISSSLPSSWENELFGPFRNLSTHDINPHKSTHIDTILQRLNSPAPQAFYVLQRALRKAFINCETGQGPSREELQMIHTTAHFLIKPGFELVIYKNDQYRSDNDEDNDDVRGSVNLPWEIIPKSLRSSTGARTGRQILLPLQHQDGCRPNLSKAPKSTLQMANEILDIVTEASQLQAPINHDSINTLVNRMTEQLSWTMGTDLRGRSSADAAFALAMAGATNERLFQSLATVSQYELNPGRTSLDF